MLCEVPLTKEQQAFATDHHGLVYKFLNENHLPEDEFYDVVIFAYLKGSKGLLFNSPSAQKFSFFHHRQRQMKFRSMITSAPRSAASAIWRFSVFMSDYIPMVRL